MNGFEISSLQDLEAMLSMIHLQAGSMWSVYSLFLSLLFGYAIAAYVAGFQLTRVQVALLNALYLTAVFITMLSVLTSFAGLGELYALHNQIKPDSFPELTRGSDSDTFAFFFVGVMLAQVCASLYFMWSIRHPKSQ